MKGAYPNSGTAGLARLQASMPVLGVCPKVGRLPQILQQRQPSLHGV